jgi:O-antigen/teichoic acid export membrane protein
MKQSQRIVKNAVFGAAAAAVGGAIQLATILFIAKKVSVDEFGKYSWVLAFAMFFQFLADSGLSRILVREVATQRENQARIVGAAVALIWISSTVMGLLLLAVLPFLRIGFDVKLAAAVMGLATLSQFHASGYGAVLRAHEDNELNQLGYVLHKIVLFSVVFVSLHRSFGLVGIAVAHLAADCTLWAFYYLLVTRFYLRVHLVADRALWKKLIVTALPMGGGVMLRQLALQADVLVLKSMANFSAVGLFSGPYRIGMALRMAPEMLALPLFPLYSRLAVESREKLEAVYQRSMKYFSLMSFPFAVFLVAWSDDIIRYAMDPKYEAAIPALRLALDAALIPHFGFLGPCIAFLLTEYLLVGVWIAQISRLGLRLSLGDALWRPLLASAAMAPLLVAVKPLSLAWQITGSAASFAVYLGALLFMKTFAAEEIATAREGLAFFRPLLAYWTHTWRRRI